MSDCQSFLQKEKQENLNNFFFDEEPPCPPDLIQRPSDDQKCVIASPNQSSDDDKPALRLLPVKLNKKEKIRTDRNGHKTYHLLLKEWLLDNNCQSIQNKYKKYFNQRVYLVLVLDQILKHVDGQEFTQSYQLMVSNLILKKRQELEMYNNLQQKSQQAAHLTRLISQIQYSLQACKLFMEGNTFKALWTVYARDKKKPTKIKAFQAARDTFREMTGHQAQDFSQEV